MKADIYFNIRTKHYSIRERTGANKGLVTQHRPRVSVDNVRFYVSQPGIKRIRDKKQKSVIAWLIGDVDLMNHDWNIEEAEPLYFNPYKVTSFVRVSDHKPVTNASKVILLENGKMFGFGLEFGE